MSLQEQVAALLRQRLGLPPQGVAPPPLQNQQQRLPPNSNGTVHSNTSGLIAASTCAARGSKRRREEDAGDDDDQHPLLNRLLCELLSGKKSFHEVKSRLEKELADVQERSRRIREAWENSVLNHLLDEDVRAHLLGFLDEEGLWVLEESTMMRLDEDALKAKWKSLWERRNPGNSLGEDDGSYRQRGIAFAEASRMARWMERLAQSKYGTNVRALASKSETEGVHQWPTEPNRTLRTERENRSFFARLSYQYAEARPPMVLEGFMVLSAPAPSIEPLRYGRSEIFLDLPGVSESDQDKLYECYGNALSQGNYYEPGFDEEAFLRLCKDAEKEMADNLSITIVEIVVDSNGEKEMNLVVSTTGCSSDGDPDYLMLAPRSADPNQSNHEGFDAIRVGMEYFPDPNTLHFRLFG